MTPGDPSSARFTQSLASCHFNHPGQTGPCVLCSIQRFDTHERQELWPSPCMRCTCPHSRLLSNHSLPGKRDGDLPPASHMYADLDCRIWKYCIGSQCVWPCQSVQLLLKLTEEDDTGCYPFESYTRNAVSKVNAEEDSRQTHWNWQKWDHRLSSSQLLQSGFARSPSK